MIDLSPSSTPRPPFGLAPPPHYYHSVAQPDSPKRRASPADHYSHLSRIPDSRPPPAARLPDAGPDDAARPPLAALSTAPNALPSPTAGPGSASGSENSTDAEKSGGAASLAVPGSSSAKGQSAAFIHKLYSMLEDPKIGHLIYWSDTNDSFIMSPTPEFSKVLASYFKHTNISSFVRQLNMYGFHKVVTDSFQSNNENAVWEFRHGNGCFNRGDLDGLRDIKRRASKHTLTSRDSYSGPVGKMTQPGLAMMGSTQNAMLHPDVFRHGMPPAPHDPIESRFLFVEHLIERRSQEFMARSDEALAAVASQVSGLTKSLVASYNCNLQLCTLLRRLLPDQAGRNEILSLQHELSGHLDGLRMTVDDGNARASRFGAQAHQRPENGYYPQPEHSRQNQFNRSARFQEPPKRYSSVGGPDHQAHYRTMPPPPPPPPVSQTHHTGHPPPPPPSAIPHLSVSSPSAGRRHTSADIRQHGWNGQLPPHNLPPLRAPPASTSPQWPVSPSTQPSSARVENQRIRDSLNSFSFGTAGRSERAGSPPPPPPHPPRLGSPVEPPSASSSARYQPNQHRGFGGSLEPPSSATEPPSRRASMASNVHSLLNHDVPPEGRTSPIYKRQRR